MGRHRKESTRNEMMPSPYSGSGGNQPTPYTQHTQHTHLNTHTFLSISFLLSMKTTKEKQRRYTSSSIRHLNLPRLFLYFLKKRNVNWKNISGKKKLFCVSCDITTWRRRDVSNLPAKKNIEENWNSKWTKNKTLDCHGEQSSRKEKKKWPVFTFVCLAVERHIFEINRGRCRPFFFK